MSYEFENIQIIWNYMKLNHKLEKADCIIAFGSHDLKVAERSAQLFLEGYAPLLIITGGLGKATEGVWEKTESEIFADIAIHMGVPKNKILLESKSTNTGENILFTKQLIKSNNIKFNTIIGVQQPYMERRLYAALRKQWEEVDCIITSPIISMYEYFNDVLNTDVSKEELINIIIGDFQRIDSYAKKGYQIPQDIPDEVWQAYNNLIRLGYNKYIT